MQIGKIIRSDSRDLTSLLESNLSHHVSVLSSKIRMIVVTVLKKLNEITTMPSKIVAIICFLSFAVAASTIGTLPTLEKGGVFHDIICILLILILRKESSPCYLLRPCIICTNHTLFAAC